MEFERVADQKRVEFIVASIRNAVPTGGDVLDIGCGNGIISRAIGAFGYRVLGIDISEKTISHARQHNTLANVNFKVVAAGELVAEPLKYHAIVCSEVLEHLHHPGNLLSIIRRSLRNDGILLVTVPNGRGPRELLVTRPVQALQQSNGVVWKLLQAIKRRLGYTGTTVQSSAEDLSHIQFFTQKMLQDLAASAQFRIETLRPTNFLEQVFPFSFLARKSKVLQKIDCRMADLLPVVFTSGFMSLWKKIDINK